MELSYTFIFLVQGLGINKGGLYIRDVQYYHQGDYTCIAKSTATEISRTARLTVTGPPYPPVGTFVTSATAPYWVMINWRMGFDDTLSSNGDPIIAYIVEKRHRDSDEWVRVDDRILARSLTEKKYNVTGLTPASTYQFRVRAENAAGVGQPSRPSGTLS